MGSNKVISFSLYGTNLKYIKGLFYNIELAELIYPDWLIYIYHDDSVLESDLEKLSFKKNIALINMSGSGIPGMFWRFMVYDDKSVQCFIVRDADSRITIREKMAVDEWLKSYKKLHIMRDHPDHFFPILGGMWGLKVDNKFSMIDKIKKYLIEKNISTNIGIRWEDMWFLEKIIYRKYYFFKIVHDTYFNYFSIRKYLKKIYKLKFLYLLEFSCRKFPAKRIGDNFIGEIFDENNYRNDDYKKL